MSAHVVHLFRANFALQQSSTECHCQLFPARVSQQQMIGLGGATVAHDLPVYVGAPFHGVCGGFEHHRARAFAENQTITGVVIGSGCLMWRIVVVCKHLLCT